VERCDHTLSRSGQRSIGVVGESSHNASGFVVEQVRMVVREYEKRAVNQRVDREVEVHERVVGLALRGVCAVSDLRHQLLERFGQLVECGLIPLQGSEGSPRADDDRPAQELVAVDPGPQPSLVVHGRPHAARSGGQST